jgi:hypothetical protein
MDTLQRLDGTEKCKGLIRGEEGLRFCRSSSLAVDLNLTVIPERLTVNENHGFSEQGEQAIHGDNRATRFIVKPALDVVGRAGDDGEERTRRLLLTLALRHCRWSVGWGKDVGIAEVVEPPDGSVAAEVLMEELGGFKVDRREIGEGSVARRKERGKMFVEGGGRRVREGLDEGEGDEKIEDVGQFLGMVGASVVTESGTVGDDGRRVGICEEGIGVVLYEPC